MTINNSVETMNPVIEMPLWYEGVICDIAPQTICAQLQNFASTGIHKQPYSYLKTVGALTGRDSHEYERYEVQKTIREKLPRVAAIIGAYLIREYQRCGSDWLVITNLSAVARNFNITPQKLKQYLVLLGGYEYYTVQLREREDRNKRVVGIQQCHLFEINFFFELEDKETPGDIIDDFRTGTPRAWYADNRRIVEIRIQPSERFRGEMYTRPYAYAKVIDGIFEVLLSLDDMAFKLACFAISNKPKWEASITKLAENQILRLGDQIRQQGYPHVLDKLTRALQRLQEVGLFSSTSCDPIPGKKDHMLRWECSDRYVEHGNPSKLQKQG